MGRKGNLAVFESSGISKTGEVTPTKFGIHAHVHLINLYFHNLYTKNTFLIQIDPFYFKNNPIYVT